MVTTSIKVIVGKLNIKLFMSLMKAKPIITELGLVNIDVSVELSVGLFFNLNISIRNTSVSPLSYNKSVQLSSSGFIGGLFSESTPMYASLMSFFRIQICSSSPIQCILICFGS